MRIIYDQLAEGRRFPLGKIATREFIAAIAPADLVVRIARVHFGANATTTQEARIIGRGNHFEVRINFWIENGRSRVIRDVPAWIRPVAEAGGRIDAGRKFVDWPDNSAAYYSGFLIAHELAHTIYAADRGDMKLTGPAGGPAEEFWCDQWASKAVLANRDVLAKTR